MKQDRFRQAAVALLAIAASLPATHAQQADWSALQSLETNSRISVSLRENKYIEWRFVNWSPTSIDLSSKRRQMTLQMQNVARVQVRQRVSRWRGALIGSLVGFAAGFVTGASSAGHLTDRNNPGAKTRVAMGSGIGLFAAGIGAPLGALAGGHKYVTVYRIERHASK